MKIRNPRVVAAAGWTLGLVARGVVRSMQVRTHFEGENLAKLRPQLRQRYLFAIWHENLLLPAIRFGGPDLAVLISQHADGQLLGGLIRQLGMTMVNGSSTRGGVEAVRQLVRDDVPWRHLAVTPDGPRGPRRVVQPGIVYIASRTGMQIVPIGVGYDQPWRLKSWDRFAIPRPGSRGRLLFGSPLDVPPGLRSPELEMVRQQIQQQLDRVSDRAEAWAASGDWPTEAGVNRRDRKSHHADGRSDSDRCQPRAA